MLSEIKADVEKQLELVMAASRHEEGDGVTDRKTLEDAKADLDSAIAKLRTIESLVRHNDDDDDDEPHRICRAKVRKLK